MIPNYNDENIEVIPKVMRDMLGDKASNDLFDKKKALKNFARMQSFFQEKNEKVRDKYVYPKPQAHITHKFRGIDVETIENFENEFPGIDVNYVFQKCIEDQEDMKYGIFDSFTW